MNPENPLKSPDEQENENKQNDQPSNDQPPLGSSLNPRDVIAYVLVILGICLLFFLPLYGGLIIGIVTGLYFSKEILDSSRKYEEFIEEQGFVRVLILGGLLLAFIISAPAIFIGIALMIALKLFLTEK